MRAVVQRVAEARVLIAGKEHASIGHGLLILLGIETGDLEQDVEWISGKIARMRLFPNEQGIMDIDVVQAEGEVMVISQFTLLANCSKGNRPSYIAAARPEEAIPLYERFCGRMGELCGAEVRKGVFGADMKVGLINDGPVTIQLDSRSR